MRSRRRVFQFALCLVALLAVSVHADPQKYDAMFVFGDSLADNGNDFIASGGTIPPSTSPHRTYFFGRFSNGYNAFERLWQMVGGGAPGSPTGLQPFSALQVTQPPAPMPLNAGIDFAFGGTGTGFMDRTPSGAYAPGLKGQVDLFRAALAGRDVPKKSLFVIVTGTNDYRLEPPAYPMAPSAVVDNITYAMQLLYDAGARDFLVMDIPDIGALPSTMLGGPAAVQAGSAATAAHNAALDAGLAGLDNTLKKIQIYRGRFANAFATVPPGVDRTTPAIETVPGGQMRSGCLFENPATCPDLPDQAFTTALRFVFWDIVHPTAYAHSLLADYAYGVLAKKKEVQTQ